MSHTPVLALEPGANDLRRQRMIRIAVVGAGHWGPNLIRSFDNKRTSEVIWVADRDATRREISRNFRWR